MKHSSPESWELLFKILTEHTTDKLLLVIDEFQYLGKSNPAFPSIFQKIWDTVLKDKNVMVILCGSLISMMESQTLSYSSPLYGRRTGQIKLMQIPFAHYQEFFPGKSHKQLIEYYAITGGIPKYIELFYEGRDVYSAISKNVLSRSSFLYDEPNFLLQREVSEVGSYFSVIKTIAAGNRKLAQMSTSLEIKQTGLTKYLKTLIDLDILEREVPVTEENPHKSKRGLYRLKDNFMLFWFKFIYPNRSFLETGNEAIVMNKIQQNLVDSHVSYVYEDVCRERMWELNARNQWGFYFDKIGRWWNNNTEIDIVALSSSGDGIIFGECKYWERKVGLSVLKELEEKARAVKYESDLKRHYILFSINGFTNELKQLAENRDDLVLWQ